MSNEQKEKKKSGLGKKLIIGFIVLCVLGAIFDSSEDATQPADTSTVSLLEVQPETFDVMSGSGNNKLGKRDYYSISKETMQTTSAEDFQKFLDEKFDKEKMWTTIDFGDGTGLVIVPLILPDVSYAKLGEQDHIDQVLGYLKWQEDGSFVYIDGPVTNQAE